MADAQACQVHIKDKEAAQVRKVDINISNVHRWEGAEEAQFSSSSFKHWMNNKQRTLT